MSTYDMLIEKGKIEGKIEVILKGVKNGLSIDILANITELSNEEILKIIEKSNFFK